MPTDKDAHKIGTAQATAIGVGGILGAGIFVLSGTASAIAGPAVIVAFGLALVGSLLLAFCYAELSSMHDDSGGPYAYAKRHLGLWPSIVTGWANWGAWICASAYVGIGLGEYAHKIIPDVPAKLLALAFILFFTCLNLFGIKLSGRTQLVIMLVELVSLVGFAALGIPKVDTAAFTNFLPYGAWSVLPAALIGFLALTGWDAIVVAAEEMRDPKRAIPKAIFSSLAIVFLIYAALLIVINGILTRSEIQTTTTPVVDVAPAVLGTYGTTAITIVVVVALTATVNAFIIVISRSGFVLARDGYAPRVLGRSSARGVPWVAVLMAGAAEAIMVTLSDVRTAVAGTGVLYTITFVTSIVCLFAARRRGVRAPFRVPAYPWVPIGALLLCVTFIASSGVAGLVIAAGWLSVGVGITAAMMRRTARRSVEQPAAVAAEQP